MTCPQGANAFVTKWSTCQATDTTLNVITCNTYTSPSGNHIWTASGNYLDTLPNNAGCDSLLTIVLTIDTTPLAPDDIIGPVTVCPGSTTIYSIAPVPGASSYTWTLPAGWTGSSTSNTISASATATGGSISVVASNNCGTSAAQTLTITVTPYPTAQFGYTANLLAVAFADMSLGSPNSWAWDFGDGGTSSLQHPMHTYATAGTYTVCLIASTNGCADTLCQAASVVAIGTETSLPFGVSVFPNPSNGGFNVETDCYLEGLLYDPQGRLAMACSFAPGRSVIDCSYLAGGVYLLRLTNGERQTSLRLVRIAE